MNAEGMVFWLSDGGGIGYYRRRLSYGWSVLTSLSVLHRAYRWGEAAIAAIDEVSSPVWETEGEAKRAAEWLAEKMRSLEGGRGSALAFLAGAADPHPGGNPVEGLRRRRGATTPPPHPSPRNR